MKKVLVIGSGGREHALAWALACSPQVERVDVAPGNGGTAWPKDSGRAEARRVPIAADDTDRLAEYALKAGIDLTVVGPEAPLAAGVVDRFRALGLKILGPERKAAALEASKSFAKALMAEAGVPTAEFATFDAFEPAREYLEAHPLPVVVKASGLAAGKGVLVTGDRDEALRFLKALMLEGRFGPAGQTVVIEEFLEGPELSVFALTDGKRAFFFPPARDHKRVFDGDRGPNTGGMGAFAPVPGIDPGLLDRVKDEIFFPVFKSLEDRGTPFTGILYAGLKLTPEGPKVLEFNVRLGDPEAQAVLPLLEGDLYALFESAAEGRLNPEAVQVKPGYALTVVAASEGYPGPYPKGRPIEGLEAAQGRALVFHAGTERQNGGWVTSGGRVLAVTGLGVTLSEAREAAYSALSAIHFAGMHYRRDIGVTGGGKPWTTSAQG